MHLLIFGLGFTTRRLAERLHARGWEITATARSGAPGTVLLDSDAAITAIARATHILSSVPPTDGLDPVLTLYTATLATSPAKWLGYLSSTGVYGDADGAWVDETTSLQGRRADRVAADRAWQALRSDTCIFRLPGIYGPGRSALDQISAGRAHRVDTDQCFSRIHVDDVGSAVIASFERGTRGIYNLGDNEPTPGRVVVEYACDLLARSYPPLIAPNSAELSPMARGFYTESRLVSVAKARRELGFTSGFPDYRVGLRACLSGSFLQVR
jgi:nucleoside-diphosphate-sugar epimerase